MKIGVKFCGGCQSRYERGDVLEIIKRNVENVDFEYALSDVEYDIFLVISGCPIKCADTKKYIYKEIVDIDSENYKNAVLIMKDKLNI